MSAERALNTFLNRFLDDQAFGSVQPLAAYQALAPGHEEVVARL
jgi:hypothetical protein